MRILRSSSASQSIALALLLLLSSSSSSSMVLAFTTPSSSTTKALTTVSGLRKTMLASRQRDDPEDQFWSIRNSWKEQTEGTTVLKSDVPSDNSNNENTLQEFKERFLKLPPSPEDQFIMTGDIAILFLYAFTSHSINDSVVKGLLEDPKMTIPDVIQELDPMHDVVNLQHPVWVDLASNPNVPFGNPSVDHALEVTAREAFLNHWGPLFVTEGSACVALCTCWLIAGWFHRAFLFDNSTYCSADRVLTKTVETWLTAALLLTLLATGTDWLVSHVPALQSLFCVTCKTAATAGEEFRAAMNGDASISTISFWSLTQSDIVFIVDSLTILISWRWSAHRVLNTFR